MHNESKKNKQQYKTELFSILSFCVNTTTRDTHPRECGPAGSGAAPRNKTVVDVRAAAFASHLNK